MSKSHCFAFTAFWLFSLHTYGQDIIPISEIPDSLKKDAKAVFLLDQGIFEITAEDKAIYKVHQVIAILNPKAQWLAAKTLGYDKHSKVNFLSGKKYDSAGNLIDKLTKSGIIDQSNYDGFSIYSDNRLKHADLRHTSYPFIVDFEFEMEYSQTFTIPDWYVIPRENVSVLKSQFSIKAPNGYQPRVKVINTDKEFSTTKQEEGTLQMDIEFSNLVAIERERDGPELNEMRPVIYCAPSNFSYSGYKGDMTSWNDFGKWILDLNSGRDELSPETVTQLKLITQEFKSKEEKIKAVYEFMQNRTRYVSIQLGIGGYQPFPASTVDELGYGDCKALSNYMYSMLKAIGIESKYTLVYAGDDPPEIDPDFPNSTFNHAILCVPNDQDTVWLECTSQTNPFGYLGTFTGDRDVFVVDESGGQIVHTITYSKEQNLQISTANVEINQSGKTNAVIKTRYSGIQSENYNLNKIVKSTEQEQKHWINKYMDIADFTIKDFSFETEKNKIPITTQKVEVAINNFLDARGNRLFFEPNLMNKWNSSPKRYSNRQTDVITKFTGIDIDSITYTIPEKFYAEYLPEPINIESAFGSYSSSVSFENGKLLYIRKLELNKGRFPKETYDEFRNFYRSISKADRSKVIFVDKT